MDFDPSVNVPKKQQHTLFEQSSEAVFSGLITLQDHQLHGYASVDLCQIRVRVI